MPSSVGKQVMITRVSQEKTRGAHKKKTKSCCKYFAHILGVQKNKNKTGRKKNTGQSRVQLRLGNHWLPSEERAFYYARQYSLRLEL